MREYFGKGSLWTCQAISMFSFHFVAWVITSSLENFFFVKNVFCTLIVPNKMT